MTVRGPELPAAGFVGASGGGWTSTIGPAPSLLALPWPPFLPFFLPPPPPPPPPPLLLVAAAMGCGPCGVMAEGATLPPSLASPASGEPLPPPPPASGLSCSPSDASSHEAPPSALSCCSGGLGPPLPSAGAGAGAGAGSAGLLFAASGLLLPFFFFFFLPALPGDPSGPGGLSAAGGAGAGSGHGSACFPDLRSFLTSASAETLPMTTTFCCCVSMSVLYTPSMLWSTFFTFFLQPSQWMLTLRARVWQQRTRKEDHSHFNQRKHQSEYEYRQVLDRAGSELLT
uniref:Uncharacterized protein n=1 Tax=Zea mays TaxID=4577 RepID=C0PJZ1_MAIZE|nr:unknown [Zea mays]